MKDRQTDRTKTVENKISVGLKGKRVTEYISSYKKQAGCGGKTLSEAGYKKRKNPV